MPRCPIDLQQSCPASTNMDYSLLAGPNQTFTRSHKEYHVKPGGFSSHEFFESKGACHGYCRAIMQVGFPVKNQINQIGDFYECLIPFFGTYTTSTLHFGPPADHPPSSVFYVCQSFIHPPFITCSRLFHAPKALLIIDQSSLEHSRRMTSDSLPRGFSCASSSQPQLCLALA